MAARRPTPERLISLLGLTLALGYLAVLVTAALGGNFLLDGEGRPIANDFVNVLAAGRLALDGNPAAAYEWTLHKAAEVRAVGHAFANYYGWHYPPPFLFVAAALATLPYLVAALVWLAATLTAAATLGGILRSRAGILLALGFPAALWNVTAGQNGFLTAALIGGTLGLLERRPALAGLCLGFLAYKPQFGLLFPIVLIADRRWLTIAVAALAAGGLAAASWLAFGGACWEAFLHWMPITGRVVLGEGAAVLAVAIAFLLRLPLQRGFSAADSGAIAAAGILILAFPYVKTQVGLAAVLIVAALVVKHTLADKSRSSAKIAARPTR